MIIVSKNRPIGDLMLLRERRDDFRTLLKELIGYFNQVGDEFNIYDII
jgi:hypothetical protein